MTRAQPTAAQREALERAAVKPLDWLSGIPGGTLRACRTRGWLDKSINGGTTRWTITPAGRAALKETTHG